MSAFPVEDLPRMVHSALGIAKGDVRELPKKYIGLWGEPISKVLESIGIRNLNDLAETNPELFTISRGQLALTGINEDQEDVFDQMARSNAPKNRRGARGGARGGRAGGFSGSRGGYGGYGAAFSTSAAPRGRGTAPRGGGYRGGRGGDAGFSSGFGRGGGSGGGFGGSGGGFDSGFGSSSRGGDGGYGNGNADRRRYDSPPRNNYGSSRGGGEDNYGRSDNRGFASNYDTFEETSRGRDYDDRDRNDRSYGNERGEERYGRGGGEEYSSREEYGRGGTAYGREDQRYEYDDHRGPVRDTNRDRDEYDDQRGGGRDRDERGGYNGQSFSITVRNNGNDYDDRRVDYDQRDERRGGDRDRGYDDRDDRRGVDRDGFRNREYDDGYDSRRRDEEYRGGYNDSRAHNLHDDRTDRDYGRADDRGYGGQQEERRGAFPSAFPSAFGGAQQNANSNSARGSVFAPQAMSEDDEPRRTSQPTYNGRGRPAGGRGEPEDPVQPYEGSREPCLPINPFCSLPPGLEQLIGKTGAPPGLNYPVGPPPGLSVPPVDPAKKTPTQRDQDIGPNQVSLDEMARLVFEVMEKEGGKDVGKDKIIGKILTHCQRDVCRVVQTCGGITRVLEKVCEEAAPDRLEFYTTDDGEDLVALRQPYKNRAREHFEKYGSSTVDDERAANGTTRQYMPDDLDDDVSDASFQSAQSAARSNTKPMPAGSSRAVIPVDAEIKVANAFWKFARTKGSYRSTLNGYRVQLAAMEGIKKMSPRDIYKYVSRPEYAEFFKLEFEEDTNGEAVQWLYAIGPEGPSKVLMGVDPEENDQQRVSPPSTTGSGMRAGSGMRSAKDDRGVDSMRPFAFRFFHKRDDPEMGYDSVRSYKRKEEVILTCFIDFYEFYVMTEKDFDKSERFCNDLYDDHCGLVFQDTNNWAKGHAGVHILTKAKKAYRFNVLAINHETGELHVRYVDLGTKEWIDFRDAVALKDNYKTDAKCFKCSLEDYEPVNEDDLWDLRRSMMKMRNIQVVIEPEEKRRDPEDVLIVSMKFTPPGTQQSKRYPDYLYKRELAAPVKKEARRD